MSSDNAPTDSLVRVEGEIHQRIALLSKQIISLSNLRVRRNFLLPVFRLPPETLAIIFTHGARDYYESNSGGYFTRCMPTWVNVSYVCHHWRNIALDCPTLWTYPFHTSLRCTEELLLRSKQAPLKISHRFATKGRSGILDRLLKHSERIQELRLHLPAWFVPANLTFCAPHLEQLEIEVRVWDNSVQPLVIIDWDKSPLRILKLANCSLPWYLLNLGGLKSLSLRRVHSPSPPNILQFLTILSGMRDLTALYLEDVLPSARGFLSSGGLGISPKVDLPSLTRLAIVAPLSAVVTLLSSVNIPLTTQLSLKPRFERGCSIDDYHPIVSFIAQRFSISEERSLSDPTFCSLIIDCSSPPKLTFSTSERDFKPHSPRESEDIPLEVILGRSKTEEIGEMKGLTKRDKRRIMSDICCSLPLTNVQTLHVIEPRFSSAIWKEILGHLGGLRYMKLSRGRMPDLSFLSLTAHEPKENLSGQQTDPTRGHIFVPALEELDLSRIMFVPDDHTTSQGGMSHKSLVDALSTRNGLNDRLTMIHCG